MSTARLVGRRDGAGEQKQGPGLTGFTDLPVLRQQPDVVLAQLRDVAADRDQTTVRNGIPLNDRAVARWSAMAIDALGRALGLPAEFCRPGGGFSVVTGASGEFVRLALAAALTRARPVHHVPTRETVYVTRHTDLTTRSAVLAAGLGPAALRVVDASPATGRMSPKNLRETMLLDTARGLRPLMVVATVGDVSGAADDVKTIAGVCADLDVWLHVDATHAGMYALLPQRRALLAGAGRASSVCVDPQVAVDLPTECAIGWTRDPAALWEPALINAFGARHHYLGLDTPERALDVALALYCAGVVSLRGRLRRQADAAQDLVALARHDHQWTLAAPPGVGSVCVRARTGHSADHDDIVTTRVIARLRQAGAPAVRGAFIGDRPVLQIRPDRAHGMTSQQIWTEVTSALAAAVATRDEPAAESVGHA